MSITTPVLSGDHACTSKFLITAGKLPRRIRSRRLSSVVVYTVCISPKLTLLESFSVNTTRNGVCVRSPTPPSRLSVEAAIVEPSNISRPITAVGISKYIFPSILWRVISPRFVSRALSLNNCS